MIVSNNNCPENSLEPWIKKYRPLGFEEMQFGTNIEKKFLRMINQKSIPNLLIHGPPGSGKTTIAKHFAAKLSKGKSENLLEINASHDRGINVIRTKIKTFCQIKTNLFENFIKLVIIDEAESLTKIAQEAFRRIIENFSPSVRFIFICNYPSKIIEPIQSRCAVLRFQCFLKEISLKTIVKVFCLENIVFSVRGLEYLVFSAGGDMRHLLNESEVICKSFYKIISQTTSKSYNIINTFTFVNFLYSFFVKNNLILFEIFIDICNQNYEVKEIIYQIFKFLKKFQFITHRKIKILKILCLLQIELFRFHFKKDVVVSILKKIV